MGHQKVLWWGSAKVDELGILERQVTQPSSASQGQEVGVYFDWIVIVALHIGTY